MLEGGRMRKQMLAERFIFAARFFFQASEERKR